MENNGTVMKELEEMKASMLLLKEKLREQEIVNENHVRKAIKGKLDDINRIAVRMLLVGLFAIIYCSFVFVEYRFSLYFVSATALILILSTVATYVQHKNLLKAKELSEDLMKETYDLVKLKKRYSQWLKIAVPLALLWFGWLAYETLFVIPDRTMGISLLTGSAVGAMVGGYFGLKIHNRTLRKVEEMLAQIDEFKNSAL